MLQQLVDTMLDWLRSLFFKQEMELTLVGLQNSGKTTLVNVIATGSFSEDMIPTVGFNMRKVTKGKVTIKLWDLGGQPRFRSMWERYCRGVHAIVYVVDSADADNSTSDCDSRVLPLGEISLAVPLCRCALRRSPPAHCLTLRPARRSCHLEERAARPARQARAGGHPDPDPGQQE